MAICRLAANRAREPRLVALLPQDEAVNQDGWQARLVLIRVWHVK